MKGKTMNTPSLAEHWKVYEMGFPNYFETYYCDEETAHYIAELETRADQEWACRIYVAERIS